MDVNAFEKEKERRILFASLLFPCLLSFFIAAMIFFFIFSPKLACLLLAIFHLYNLPYISMNVEGIDMKKNKKKKKKKKDKGLTRSSNNNYM